MTANTNNSQTQINSNKAETMTFGIEIETLKPNSLPMTIGGYHRGATIPHGQNGFPGHNWTTQHDSSLNTTLRTHSPVEIVSPVLKGREGLEEVLAVAAWLEAKGFRTNASCGTHVHIGYVGAAGSTDENRIATWAANLVNLTAQFEMAIRGAAGSWSRIQNARGQEWCRSIRTDAHRAGAERARRTNSGKLDALCEATTRGYSARYHILNLTRLARRMHTVEFRAFTGTTSGLKMIAWIQLCLALCERASGRAVSFDARQSACYRGNGDATKSLDRFFFNMGWTLGRKDRAKAEVVASGWAADLSLLKAAKKELRRLAKKFDSEAPASAIAA